MMTTVITEMNVALLIDHRDVITQQPARKMQDNATASVLLDAFEERSHAIPDIGTLGRM